MNGIINYLGTVVYNVHYPLISIRGSDRSMRYPAGISLELERA